MRGFIMKLCYWWRFSPKTLWFSKNRHHNLVEQKCIFYFLQESYRIRRKKDILPIISQDNAILVIFLQVNTFLARFFGTTYFLKDFFQGIHFLQDTYKNLARNLFFPWMFQEYARILEKLYFSSRRVMRLFEKWFSLWHAIENWIVVILCSVHGFFIMTSRNFHFGQFSITKKRLFKECLTSF